MCPQGWQKAGYWCYLFSKDTASWYDARKLCQQQGGELAIVDSVQDLADLNALRVEQGR